MIEADRADHSRAKLDHDLIVPITTNAPPKGSVGPNSQHRSSPRLPILRISILSTPG